MKRAPTTTETASRPLRRGATRGSLVVVAATDPWWGCRCTNPCPRASGCQRSECAFRSSDSRPPCGGQNLCRPLASPPFNGLQDRVAVLDYRRPKGPTSKVFHSVSVLLNEQVRGQIWGYLCPSRRCWYRLIRVARPTACNVPSRANPATGMQAPQAGNDPAHGGPCANSDPRTTLAPFSWSMSNAARLLAGRGA